MARGHQIALIEGRRETAAMTDADTLEELARGPLSAKLNRAIALGAVQRRVVSVRQMQESEIFRRGRYVRQQPREIVTHGINIALLSEIVGVGSAGVGLLASFDGGVWHAITAGELAQHYSEEEISVPLRRAQVALAASSAERPGTKAQPWMISPSARSAGR